MKNPENRSTNNFAPNGYEYYRSRASQERSIAMQEFFGHLFGRR